jgi:uncharacterized protein (TIGR04255 family)
MKDLGSKAPIVEAMVYLDFSCKEITDVDQLHIIANSLSHKFPEKREIWLYESILQIDNKDKNSSNTLQKKELEGLRIESPDRSEVLQIKHNNLSYSQLKPYKGGNHLIQSFKTILDTYKNQREISSIRKMGLRYINNFCMPARNCNEYFKITPEINIASETPLFLGESSQSYTIKSPAHDDCEALVSTNLTGTATQEVNVIFDIDVFKTFEQKEFKSLEMCYSQLRTLKNDLFFGNFTEKSMEELFNDK